VSNRLFLQLLICVAVAAAGVATAQAPVVDPWAPSDLLPPAHFAASLASGREKPSVVYVGFKALFHPGHIPGATMQGPASTPEGLEALRKWAQSLPRDAVVVIYCGCCPLVHCPNVRPAFSALKATGFTNVRVLELATNFGADWVEKGYPVDRQ
jgi:hypothetical protein